MTEKTVLAVGDHVRLGSRATNQHQAFQASHAHGTSYHEPVEGLILSIRDIKTGHLLDKVSGHVGDCVIELLYDNTFNTKYASLRNAPRGSERPTSTPTWQRMRALLREGAEKGQLYTTSIPASLSDSPLAKLLDGWKVVKIHASAMENLEHPTSGETE